MDRHALECLDFPQVRDLLADYACTSLGRGLAARIEPSPRFDVVQRWHAQFRTWCKLLDARGRPPFAGVSDVRDAVRRCTPPLRVSVAEMAAIGDALQATHEFTRYLADLPAEWVELTPLIARIGDFRSIAEQIRRMIDERGEVRDDASPKLARIRSSARATGEEILAVADRLLRDANIRKLMQYPNYTFHNDRIVLPLRTEYRGRLAGIIHRSSDSGATVYVEPSVVVELNNQIMNLRSEENEEIARVLWTLAHEVHINEREILRTLDALAVLDLLTAKVRFAENHELRSPELTSEPIVRAPGARHPLLVNLVRQRRAAGEALDDVIAIDYRLGDDFDLLVITGPNTGGKTVTLKTVGLLTLMVQAGLPAPVGDGALFGVFRRVLIDIGDEQNMQQSLSTFSAHMRRQLDMLRKAGPSTLMLIDELGAGTDPDEGAAIGRAILDELLRRGCRGVATTHIGALKSYPLSQRRAENGCVDFNVETLRPTYHLRIGEPGLSNAIAIAARLGMPEKLVAAARRNLSNRHRALNAALEQVSRTKRAAEDARRMADRARLAADKARGAADDAKAEFERKQTEFQRWLAHVALLKAGDSVRVRDFARDGVVVRMRLEQQRAEIAIGALTVDAPLTDLLPPDAPAPDMKPARPIYVTPQTPDDPRRRHEGRRNEARPADGGPRAAPRPKPVIPSLDLESAKSLRPGDRLYVKRFHREGFLVRINAEKRIAIVAMGVFGEVEAPFSGLALSESARAARAPRSDDQAPSTPQPAPKVG